MLRRMMLELKKKVYAEIEKLEAEKAAGKNK
jgi:hypothetical protein